MVGKLWFCERQTGMLYKRLYDKWTENSILSSSWIRCLFTSANPTWKQCTVFYKYVHVVTLICLFLDKVMLVCRWLYPCSRYCIIAHYSLIIVMWLKWSKPAPNPVLILWQQNACTALCLSFDFLKALSILLLPAVTLKPLRNSLKMSGFLHCLGIMSSFF